MDANKLISMSAATPVTLTIPTDIAAPLSEGTQIMITQYGIGQVTITGDTGVTVNSYGSAYKMVGQYSTAFVTKQTTNVWILDGNLTTLTL